MRLSALVVVMLGGAWLASGQRPGGGGGRLEADPTSQGPVLFPNDAPPAPRPPLVVTSRPLAESIARSDLAAAEGDNSTLSLASSPSHLSGRSLAFEPYPYLARVQQYRLYSPSPTFDYNNLVSSRPPSVAVGVTRSRLTALDGDTTYHDYEDLSAPPPPPPPPIYKAIANHAHAHQKVVRIAQRPDKHRYKTPLPRHSHNYGNNDYGNNNYGNDNYGNNDYGNDDDGDNSDNDENQNYAFSYTVKDQKTGDDFSHSQKSSGSGTNGEYRVRLPDGRTQVVAYTADRRGYNARVSYEDGHGASGAGAGAGAGADRGHGAAYRHTTDDYFNTRDDHSGGEDGLYRDNDRDLDTNTVHRHDDDTARSGHGQLRDAADGRGRDDYYYPDVSKESYNDYSAEYNSRLEPHSSKYATFNDHIDGTGSTVRPTYEQLKHLFLNKRIYSTRQHHDPVPSNVPSSVPADADHVVVSGAQSPGLYTNIRSSLPAVPSYTSPKVVVASTPRSYLVSTIASLKNKVHLASKPILSDRFIEKINKYLSFN